MKHIVLFVIFFIFFLASCHKNNINEGDTTDLILIDSLKATYYVVKAWDTTTITCYAKGDSIIYSWECDHGNFNGSGHQIKYAAGECCIGINTITSTVSNSTGKVSEEIKIEVTSFYDD